MNHIENKTILLPILAIANSAATKHRSADIFEVLDLRLQSILISFLYKAGDRNQVHSPAYKNPVFPAHLRDCLFLKVSSQYLCQ